MKQTVLSAILLGALAACNNPSAETDKTPAPVANTIAVLNYTVTNVYPHDTGSYTEGLEWHDDMILESTGDTEYKGKSKLAKIDLKTGKDIQQIHLGAAYFGEGTTQLNGKIYMLTWREGKCFVFDQKTLQKTGEFNYTGEGWGMTNDGKYLIMDDGSNNLYYRDPKNFQVVKSVGVSDNNGPLASINELEYVDGFIYANVWITNTIVKIDPATGNVVAKADFTGLLNKYAPGSISDAEQANNAVLNGIAYDSVGKRFFITGKLWPKLFELKFQ